MRERLPFRNLTTGTEISKSVVSACRNIVETALIKTQRFSVLSYTNIEEILTAQEFALSDCTDEACAVEIGKLLAAEQIVVGELIKLNERLVLSIRLVDVATGRSLRAETVVIDSEEELQNKTIEATYLLVDQQYVPDKQSASKQKRAIPGTDRAIYRVNQLGGGAIVQSGITIYILKGLIAFDAMAGVSAFSYDDVYTIVPSISGLLAIFTADAIWYWFRNPLTPYLGLSMSAATDFSKIAAAAEILLGLRISVFYLHALYLIPLNPDSSLLGQFPMTISLAVGMRI